MYNDSTFDINLEIHLKNSKSLREFIKNQECDIIIDGANVGYFKNRPVSKQKNNIFYPPPITIKTCKHIYPTFFIYHTFLLTT